ncbi:MAG: DUF452 family protein, partial [Desulfobulbaceae bacterium]|nr:DUF452 family protein [Desulfobulbaceae bacterium]
KKCLLFLAGWGMDPTPFADLPSPGVDVLLCYDYSEMNLGSLPELLTDYNEVHLTAWSMGVWVGARLFEGQSERFASSTAINGTLCPIDDKRGLDGEGYRRMLDNFSETILTEFYDQMFNDQLELLRFCRSRPQRSPEDIHRELALLYEAYQASGPAPDIYHRKIVSGHDRIFSIRNQVRAWGREGCESMRIPHFPFYGWNGFSAPDVTCNAA